MIPNIQKKDSYWAGVIKLIEWTYHFKDSEYIELNIGGEEYVDEIKEKHINGYNYLVENQNAILNQIINAIYEYYCKLCDDFDLENCFVDERDSFIKTISPHRIYILDIEKDNIPYIGYEFSCNWEFEHGIGVMLYKNRIVDIGFAETAFLSEIAEEDLDN